MINERDVRRIRAFKTETRLAPGQIKFLIVAQWRLGLSCDMSNETTQWSFSARLSNLHRASTEDDWEDLGMICAFIGASMAHSVTPIDKAKSGAVIHWAWLTMPDGTSLAMTADKNGFDAVHPAAANEAVS